MHCMQLIYQQKTLNVGERIAYCYYILISWTSYPFFLLDSHSLWTANQQDISFTLLIGRFEFLSACFSDSKVLSANVFCSKLQLRVFCLHYFCIRSTENSDVSQIFKIVNKLNKSDNRKYAWNDFCALTHKINNNLHYQLNDV